MIEYGELLAGVERLEKMGGLQEALDLLHKMKQVFPDRENEIVLRMLKIMFQQEHYEETLDVAVEYISNDDGSIFQWLLQMYYDPFREESENIKKRNMECLEQYAYFYDAEDKNNIKALLYDGCEKLIFCGEQTIGRYVGTPEIELKNDEIALISNVLNIPCLAEQISKDRKSVV